MTRGPWQGPLSTRSGIEPSLKSSSTSGEPQTSHFSKAAQLRLCESAFPEGRPTSQYYTRPECGMLCIVQSCYHMSGCRWNTQGHSKGRNVPELPMEGSARADVDTRGALRQSVVGKWWKLPDCSPDNPINSLRQVCPTTLFFPVEFQKQLGGNHPCNMCPTFQQRLKLGNRTEARRWRQDTDGGPSTTANNNSAGTENSANPQNNVNCLSKLKLVSLWIAYFYAVHFTGIFTAGK